MIKPCLLIRYPAPSLAIAVKRRKDAEELLNSALQRSPGFIEAQVNLATLQLEMQNTFQSESNYLNVRRAYPDYLPGCWGYARLLVEKDRLKKGLGLIRGVYEKCLERSATRRGLSALGQS